MATTCEIALVRSREWARQRCRWEWRTAGLGFVGRTREHAPWVGRYRAVLDLTDNRPRLPSPNGIRRGAVISATMSVRMFDEYRRQVIDLRRMGEALSASIQVLEETELNDDAAIARWLEELDRAATAGGEAARQACELRSAIAGAWPRPLEARPPALDVDPRRAASAAPACQGPC